MRIDGRAHRLIFWTVGIFLLLILLCSVDSTRLSASSDLDGWTALGPGGGTVLSLVPSPNFQNDRTLFAGTVRGVYRSIDGGDSWDRFFIATTP